MDRFCKTVTLLLLYSIIENAECEFHKPHTVPKLRISGGKEAEVLAAPYMVFIDITGRHQNDMTDEFCGGSLISDRHVLTAAQCFKQGRKIRKLLFGAHDRVRNDTGGHQKLPNGTIIFHDEYNEFLRTHDIAIIKLPEAVNLTDYVKPVTLPNATAVGNTYTNESVQIFGWGWVHVTPTWIQQTSVLMNANLTVISADQCRAKLAKSKYPFLYEYEICAADEETDEETGGACRGDTGGAVMLEGVQIGILSQTTGHCERGEPTVIINVADHLDWITEQLNES